MFVRIALAIAFLCTAATMASSETIYCTITKVEGTKVTYRKIILGKPAKVFDPVTAETIKGVVVCTTTKDKVRTEIVKDGLQSPLFKNIDAKGLRAWITIIDKGDEKAKIAEIKLRLPEFGK